MSIPIIASLNGTTKGGWVRYAKLMQDAGADALELNIYFIAADLDMTGADVENRYLDLVAAVKESISIPLAVKVGPVLQLAWATWPSGWPRPAPTGWSSSTASSSPTSTSTSWRPTPQLRAEHVATSCCCRCAGSPSCTAGSRPRWPLTSGIHDADGHDQGPAGRRRRGHGRLGPLQARASTRSATILAGLSKWMEEKEYDSVEQLKGSMSQENCPDPAAFERGNYMKALTSFVGKEI